MNAYQLQTNELIVALRYVLKNIEKIFCIEPVYNSEFYLIFKSWFIKDLSIFT